eukprot:scaffold3670_cov124-Cylindrotheca_fusiformis.AAC.21
MNVWSSDHQRLNRNREWEYPGPGATGQTNIWGQWSTIFPSWRRRKCPKPHSPFTIAIQFSNLRWVQQHRKTVAFTGSWSIQVTCVQVRTRSWTERGKCGLDSRLIVFAMGGIRQKENRIDLS